jgi:heme exporter protein B
MIQHPNYFQVLMAMLKKDLLVELRNRDMLTAILIFSCAALLIFNFAFDLDVEARMTTSAGVIWVTFIFSGSMGLNRSFALEKEKDCLSGLMLAPVDRTVIYLSKLISTFVIMILAALIILPFYGLLFKVNLMSIQLFLIVIFGFWGYCAAGTLLSSMTIQTRTRDILLTILLFPILIPLLLAVVSSTTAILQGKGFQDYRIWFDVILVYDILFTTISFMVFDYVLQE